MIRVGEQNQHATTSDESCLASTLGLGGGNQRLTLSFSHSSTGNAKKSWSRRQRAGTLIQVPVEGFYTLMLGWAEERFGPPEARIRNG